MKRYLFLAPMLALAGCGAGEIASTGAGVAGLFLGARPAATAPAVVPISEERLSDKVKLATAEGNRLADYFETGRIPTSTSPDTAHPNFCPMVIADMAVIAPLDDGGAALALKCRILYHREKAKTAFEDRNAAAYDDQLDKMDGAIGKLTLILDRYKGAVQ